MPIYEYHSYEDEEDFGYNRGSLFDGRWIVKEGTDKHSNSKNIYKYLEWIDLFGLLDKKRVIMPSCPGDIQLLSDNLALLIQDHAFQEAQLLRGLRLDWNRQEIIKGESVLERSDQWTEAVIVDRAGPLANGDICFLLIKDGGHRPGKPFEYAYHCRLDSRGLKIVRDSRPIPLDSDDFNCIDLNGDIISGLSTSLLEIKRYNFRTGKMVDTVLVHGLPSTISCLWHKNMKKYSLWLSRSLDR